MKANERFKFSYSIKTVNDKSTMWASRMDHYFMKGDHDIHMKELLISLSIIVVTGCVLWCLIARTVNKDVESLNQRAITIRAKKS